MWVAPDGFVEFREQAESAFTKGGRREKKEQLSLGDEVPGAEMEEQLKESGTNMLGVVSRNSSVKGRIGKLTLSFVVVKATVENGPFSTFVGGCDDRFTTLEPGKFRLQLGGKIRCSRARALVGAK